MTDSIIKIASDSAEKYELRPCVELNTQGLRKPLYAIDDIGIEYDEALSDYCGMWSTYKLYLRIGDVWYEVWHFAFHRTNGMHGSYSCGWGWKHLTAQ